MPTNVKNITTAIRCPVAEGEPRASGGADTYYCSQPAGHYGPCSYPSVAWVRRCRLRVDGTQTGPHCALSVNHLGKCSPVIDRL
jgi:hypothetical protein